jgi:hypothetical protein
LSAVNRGRSRPRVIAAAACLAGSLDACSLDIIPVHYSRVNSAKLAEEPLRRGPGAPGAFTHSVSFAAGASGPKGLLFDPSQLEVSDSGLRFKPGAAGEREATLVVNAGIPFDALDQLLEQTGPRHRARIRYQLSRDNATWYYRAPQGWALAGPSSAQANTAEELQAHLGRFHQDVGTGSLYLRLFFKGALPDLPLELRAIELHGVRAPIDGWN